MRCPKCSGIVVKKIDTYCVNCSLILEYGREFYANPALFAGFVERRKKTPMFTLGYDMVEADYGHKDASIL